MLGISCLARNTSLLQDLKDLVEYIGFEKISNGKPASVRDIYNEVRKAGVEVDLQTIGHIYNEALPKDYKEIQSDEEVNDYILKNYKDVLERAVSLEESEDSTKQIGEDKPEIHIVNGLLNMLANDNIYDESTKSDMLTMQNALWKGIQRKLNLPEKSKPKDEKEWKDILSQSLGYEQLGLIDLHGRLNSISDLYNAMRDQLQDAKSRMLEKADEATMQRWNEMVNQLEASTYSLLFSKGEAKSLLEGMMKEAGFSKTTKDGTTILDWNKLSEGIGSVQDVRANVEKVLSQNGFNADVIEGVKNSLQNEFENLQARVLEKNIDKETNAAVRQSERIKKLQKELLRVAERRSSKRPNKGSKDDVDISQEEIDLKDQIKEEKSKWEKEKKSQQQGRADQRRINNEIDRQFNTIERLSEKLSALKNGTYAAPVKGTAENDVQEIEDLKEQVRKESEMTSQENRLGKSAEQKRDLKRLAELNNLGVFDSQHDRLLYNLIGVPELEQQDIDDLKLLADAASDLFREIEKTYGSDIYASRHLQTIQRSIDKIIARNINNKSKLMRIVNAIKALLDMYLTGLLMRPFTILENLWSGVKEIIVPTIFGKGLKKEDFKVYRKMLSDVTIRGQAFGEEIGNFSPQELYTNTLKYKLRKGNLAGDMAENLLMTVMLPGRIGLLGFDSANKATITNKTFNNAIYQALKQSGMSKDDATKFMNEALYGKSFKDAENQAKDLMDKINKGLPDRLKVPVNSRTITTFANDLVKHNLNANGALTNDVIEGAYKSAYHVAGYGLGHEANNWVSSGVKQYRNRRKQEEDRLVKEKSWNKLAMHRLKDTFVNGMIIRFTGGAMNWVYLRFQSGLGLGLATGFMGNWNGDIDFADKKSIQSSIKEIQNRRNMIARSVVGISATAVSYAVGYAMWGAGVFGGTGGGSDEEKEQLATLIEEKDVVENSDKTKYKNENGEQVTKSGKLAEINEKIKLVQRGMSPYKAIRANWMESRLFKKVVPDVMLLHYYIDTDRSNYLAVLNYVQQTTGLGSDFSTSSKIQSASTLAYRGDFDAANGQLASVAGERFGVPTWQAYKDWGKLVQWIGGGTPKTDYKKPTDLSEGLWGGGALEDLGFFKRNPTITNLPGIGGKGYEKFKAQGIERINDLKENPDWYNMKGEDGKYILDKDDREKAKKGFDKYIEQE